MSMYGIGSRVEHISFGKGTIVDVGSQHYEIWFKSQNDTKNIASDYEGLKVLEANELVHDGPAMIPLADVEMALKSVIEQYADWQEIVPMGQKWHGGTMKLQPADTSLASKDIPIDSFFHKIVMVRDRLRVLEANINAHKVLTDEDKVDLQQYITRCYGSLTTFNVLFKSEHHQFKGSGGQDKN